MVDSSKRLLLALHQAAQADERRATRTRSGFRAVTEFVPRRIRQLEDQLVLDQLAHRQLLAGNDPVRRARVSRLGVDLGLRRRQHQQLFRLHLEWHWLEAALTAQLQGAAYADPQTGPPARVARPLQRVPDLAGVGREQLAQARKAAQRPDP